jgi:hypothetical protein
MISFFFPVGISTIHIRCILRIDPIWYCDEVFFPSEVQAIFSPPLPLVRCLSMSGLAGLVSAS